MLFHFSLYENIHLESYALKEFVRLKSSAIIASGGKHPMKENTKNSGTASEPGIIIGAARCPMVHQGSMVRKKSII